MRRFVGLALGLLLVLIMLVPAALAADTATSHTGRVLFATDGDITVPAGEQADAVIVVSGTAKIEGVVNTVVVVDGAAVLTGAQVETLVAIRGPVTLGDGTVVSNDIYKLDSLVTKNGTGDVRGEIKDIAGELTGFGFVLAPLFMLLFLGFAIVAVASGLLVAALAARQVREAEALISRRPMETFLVGLAGIFVPIVLLAGLFITVVGIPLALALLLVVWPALSFLGYLVAGIWIGDWVLRQSAPDRVRERPYLASFVGLVVLAVASIVPPLTMIASLFGYGAVLTLAWRTFRGTRASELAAQTRTGAALPA